MYFYASFTLIKNKQKKAGEQREEPLMQYQNKLVGSFKNLKHNGLTEPNAVICTKNT